MTSPSSDLSIGAIAGDVLSFDTIGLEVAYYFPLASLSEGATSATLQLQLPRNALVDRFQVQVKAQRVDRVQAQQVAQVRRYSQSGGNELVIDFGTPRTVSTISLPSPLSISGVFAWLGSQFNTVNSLPRNPSTGLPITDSSVTFPELRTERLRVQVSAKPSDEQLEQLVLHLPEPPSGLAIAIDGAPPVWLHPDPVQPRPAETTAKEDGWDRESQRLVDLTDALAALTGDPLADETPATFTLTLTTAVPCTLAISQTLLQTRRVRRVRFGEGHSTTLAFGEEGLALVPLPTPPASGTRSVSSLRWVAEADLGPQRTLPPLGPEATPGEGGLPLAQALLTPEVAAIVQLPLGSGVMTLQALRLPLQALGDGAEVRAVLWAAGPPETGGTPDRPLPDASSDPVTLAPGDTEAWVSLPFKRPPILPTSGDSPMPWAALVVARGQVALGLAAASGNPAALVDQMRLRRGPPNGPWKALPAPLQSASALIDARGRLRLCGLPPKGAPLAPLTLALDGSASTVDLNPLPKGEAGRLELAAGAPGASPPGGVQLRITSRVAGRLTLRDVDVVSNV